MIKHPDTDPKIASLPNTEPQVPRLDIQSAANFLSGVNRLNEIRELGNTPLSAELCAEKASIKKELGSFVSAHAVDLVQAYLQCATILHPLQQSLASIIVPCVHRALEERDANAEPTKH